MKEENGEKKNSEQENVEKREEIDIENMQKCQTKKIQFILFELVTR